MSFDAARKELDVQPYQLYAWIGQKALEERKAGKEISAANTGTVPDIARLLSERMTGRGGSDAEKQILEAYICRYIIGVS